jgi:hypothetical protein
VQRSILDLITALHAGDPFTQAEIDRLLRHTKAPHVGYLKQQGDPLPCYRPGGKLLVKRSDFDRWMSGYRSGQAAAKAVDRVVDDLLRDFI